MREPASGKARGRTARAALEQVPAEFPDPKDSVGDAARKTLALYTLALRAHAQTLRGGDSEALHQMRVALRRLRAAIRLFASGLPANVGAQLGRELRWLGLRLGAVRDVDVQLARLLEISRQDTQPMRAARPKIETYLKAQRRARRAELIAALDSARYRRLLQRLERATSSGSPLPPAARESVRVVASKALKHVIKTTRKQGRKLDAHRHTPEPESLHRLRILVRRTRYWLELLCNLTGKPGQRVTKRLIRIQDALGTHQDAMVATQFVLSYLDHRRSAPDRSVLAGMHDLIAEQNRLAASARIELHRQWRRFSSEHTRSEIRHLLQRV